jgi:Mce-associated membrane protein
MSNESGTPLKLIKGGAAPDDPPAERPARTVRHRSARRTVKRRTPRQPSSDENDALTRTLRTLDVAPVSDGSTVEAATSTVDGPAAARKPKPAAKKRRKKSIAPPRRRFAMSGGTAALIVLLAVAVSAALFSGQRWYADHALERAHQQALAAAKQVTVDFVSVSAASVDRDLQRIVSGSTGDFHEEFTRGQAQVRTAVVENNVDSRGTVLRAALLSGSMRHAVVLVAMDATVKNVKAPEGRVSHYRIQVEVDRAGDTGEWLVSKLQFVG